MTSRLRRERRAAEPAAGFEGSRVKPEAPPPIGEQRFVGHCGEVLDAGTFPPVLATLIDSVSCGVLLFGSAATLWTVLLGAVGAMLPDPLQVVQAHFPNKPLRTLQRFHRWAHSDQQVHGLMLGIGTQAAFVAAVSGFASVINHGAFATAAAMVR